MLNPNPELNKTKQVLRIASVFAGFGFFLLGLILPMPFYNTNGDPLYNNGHGDFTLFNIYEYEKINGAFTGKGHWTWEINIAGLICFLFLMFSWIGASYATFKLSKCVTWKDLRIMIFKMQDLMPITISNSLLEMIRELETMTRQERKQKQVEYVKLINNTIYSYKDTEEKLMAETLKMLEIERAKNKDAIEKAKKWDDINKKVVEDL